MSSLAARCLQGLFLIKAWDSLSKARDHGEPLKDPRLCPLYSLLASELLPKEEPDCVPVESHPCTVSPGSLLLTISSNTNLSVKPPCCRLPGNQGFLGCSYVLCSFLPCKWWPLSQLRAHSGPRHGLSWFVDKRKYWAGLHRNRSGRFWSNRAPLLPQSYNTACGLGLKAAWMR